MKMFKQIIISLAIVLVLIQFIPVKKNVSTIPSVAGIETKYKVPADVKQILQTACNDCHSNNTQYPWYNKIQPITWYLNNHVKDGKRHLNLDSFANYPAKKQAHKMDEFVEQIQEGEMPLSSYTLIHTDAKLTEVQKEILINWASGVKQQILTH